jgi:NitT/TauT family transport system substrate-binding protein
MSLSYPRRAALVRCGAAIAAAALGLRPRAGAAQNVAIRVVGAPFDGAAEPFYAIDAGFFRKAGFEAEVTSLSSGPATMAAVASGTIEFGASNLASLAIAHERGLPLVMVSGAGTYDAGAAQKTAALLVAKTSPIGAARDLAGKTIAVNALKGIGEVAARAWLDANHAASTSVNFIELPFSQMDAALAAGRIDAAIVEEPALSAALSQNSRVLGYAYDAIAKRFNIGAWFATKEYASAHPEIVRKFAEAIAATAVWANHHRPESARILEKYSKAIIAPDMARTTYAEHLRAAEVQPLIDASEKYGVLKATFPASDMIAPGLAT